MSDADLRDLLRAAAPEPDRPDPAAIDRAWRDGRRRRTDARTALVGAVAAAVVAVGAVVVLGRPGSEVAPAPSPTSPASTPSAPEDSASAAGPDTTFLGAPVWVSPAEEDRSSLSHLEDSGLPATIDLSGESPPASALERAVGVINVDGASRVLAVGADGATYSLELGDRIDPVTDEGGNVMLPLSDEGLSPDGTRVFFRQERALVLYDFGARTWTRIATPRWTAETAQWVDDGIFVPDQPWGSVGAVYSPDGTRSEERTMRRTAWDGGDPYGPERTAPTGDVARSYFVSTDPESDGWSFAGVNAVVVSVDGRPRVLVHDIYEPGGKLCCPVAGWLGSSVVVFQSGTRLLAWEAPDGGVRLVTEILGLRPGVEGYVASWALPAA